MMAISGKGFCASAEEAFYLMVRSTAQYTITHGTTKLFFTLGRLLIISITAFSGYVFIMEIKPYS